MKHHIFGGICQVLFRKKWGDFRTKNSIILRKMLVQCNTRIKADILNRRIAAFKGRSGQNYLIYSLET